MFTQEELDRLSVLFEDVSSRFTYVTDEEQFGLHEHWKVIPDYLLSVGKIKGDCDEFARICMLKAMQLGFDARLVFCVTDFAEGHLICEVTNKDRDDALYLDNKEKKPVGRTYLPYTFLSASPWNPCKGETRPWQKIKLTLD